MKKDYDSVDLVELFKSLIGQKIICVDEVGVTKILTTDKGVKLTVEENEGCGGCGNGWSSFVMPDDLTDCNNAIVDVSITSGNDGEGSYILSIFKENKQISKILTDDGYGNGYYGGGFQIEVTKIREE